MPNMLRISPGALDFRMDLLTVQTTSACFHTGLVLSPPPVHFSFIVAGMYPREALVQNLNCCLGRRPWTSLRKISSRGFRKTLLPAVLASRGPPPRIGQDVKIGASVELIRFPDLSGLWKWRIATQTRAGCSLSLSAVSAAPILRRFRWSGAFYVLALAVCSTCASRPQSFTIAVAMLSGLLLRNVIGVFGSSHVFRDDVIGTVSLSARLKSSHCHPVSALFVVAENCDPMKVASSSGWDGSMTLIFPQIKGGSFNQYSMLELRGIAAPGLLTTLILQFDQSRVTAAAGKKCVVGERWRKFFIDPSQWWDHRVGKTSARYPDFKHMKTGEALWVHDNSNPDWVKAELAAMAPGTVELPVAFWNKRLARYVRDGQDEKALELFQQMQQEGRKSDTFTFVPVLKACGSLQALEEGRRIHTLIMQTGLESDLFVGTSLIDMYAKCGSTEEARRVFNKMSTRDAVTWTAMIVGYMQCAEEQKALQLYALMKLAGVKPVSGTFVGVLNACANVGALEEGKRVHAQTVQSGCESNPFVSSSLVDMYAKCGSIDEARIVFEKTGAGNVVSWTALIMGYVKCGQGRKALELYGLMELEEVQPVPLTFVGVLNACASVGALEEGRRLHEQIMQSGCLSDVFVSTSLIDMYAKCGSMKEAQELFDEMEYRNVATWNAMLTGYVKCGLARKAIELYRQMLAGGVDPVSTTFAVVLNACTSLGSLDEGKRVHAEIIHYDCEADIFVGTSLVDMYAKCGSIETAWRFFIHMPSWDVAAWTAMIMGYVYCGDCKNALALYYQMELEGVEAAPDTFVQVLMSSCAIPEEGDVIS